MKPLQVEAGKQVWSWDILIMRCESCKGLVEGSPSETLEQTMRRHLKAVHGVSATTVEFSSTEKP